MLGAHGDFGEKAKELWKILVGHAKKVQERDWRHSWTAMSYRKVWEQKLSIALANAEAVGHQQRAPAVTRRVTYVAGDPRHISATTHTCSCCLAGLDSYPMRSVAFDAPSQLVVVHDPLELLRTRGQCTCSRPS